MSQGIISGGDLLDLVLLHSAGRYDLRQRSERRRSCRLLQHFFMGLQRRIRPDMTLEIGAFGAEFSVQMARLGIPAHAFEANPHNFARFAPGLAGQEGPLSYHNLAVAGHCGTATFEIKRAVEGQGVAPVAGNNSLLRRAEGEGTVEYESVEVPATTLDAFLGRLAAPGATFSAWIDIEGALGALFEGAQHAFDACQSVLVEVEDKPFWKGQMLAREAREAFMARGLIPVARDFERPFQYNVVFMRPQWLHDPAVRVALADHLRQIGPASTQAPNPAPNPAPSPNPA